MSLEWITRCAYYCCFRNGIQFVLPKLVFTHFCVFALDCVYLIILVFLSGNQELIHIRNGVSHTHTHVGYTNWWRFAPRTHDIYEGGSELKRDQHRRTDCWFDPTVVGRRRNLNTSDFRNRSISNERLSRCSDADRVYFFVFGWFWLVLIYCAVCIYVNCFSLAHMCVEFIRFSFAMCSISDTNNARRLATSSRLHIYIAI